MIRVAILSAWHVHAPDYARQIKRIGGAEVTAVWDSDTDRGKPFAAELGVPFYSDLDDLLSSDDIDAVVVTAPTSSHEEVIVKAAQAGKHVFTEKVMALTLDECRRIEEAVTRAGVKFCISFPQRCWPANLYAKQIKDQGLLGQVTLARIRNAHDGASTGWLPPHFYNESECGGGSLIDLGAHPMYLARWIMGRPAAVTACLTTVTGKPVDDNAVVVLRYADGSMAIVETSFVSHSSPFALELYGTEGSLLVGGPTGSVQLYTRLNKGIVQGWVSPSALPRPLVTPMEQWISAISNGTEISFGVTEGTELTELMQAAMTSHREGKTVTLA